MTDEFEVRDGFDEPSLPLKKTYYKITDDCVACDACKDECPVDAISAGDTYKIDKEACIGCGACTDYCPVECIVVA